MSNLLLHAAGAMKTSDSGGREVVDEMLSVTPEDIRVGWSGTDRPEFTDFDGISKVCVEAERTNRIYNSDTSTALRGRSVRVGTESRLGIEGAVYSVEEGQSNPQIHVRQDDSLDFIAGKEYTFSVFVDSANSDFFRLAMSMSTVASNGLSAVFTPSSRSWVVSVGNANVINHHVRDEYIGEGIYRLEGTIILEEDAEALYCWLYFGDNHNVWTGGWQLENDPYPTNYIPTSGSTVTRLAPTVPIEDALPLTGTVAGVVDMVRDPDVNQYIFDGGDVTATNRSRLIITSGGNLQAAIHGSAGGQIVTTFPFSISNYERFVMKWAISWDYEAIRLFVQAGDEKYLYTNAHSVNDPSNRTVVIGASREGSIHSSIYFKSLHPDAIVRTTEEEFEQLFEVIS